MAPPGPDAPESRELPSGPWRDASDPGRNPAQGALPSPRQDRVVSIPLIRLFAPEADPTERFPRERADLEGYVLAPDRTITVALTAEGPRALDLLDSIWNAVERKRVGRRNHLVLDERGRTVCVMSLGVEIPPETLELLRSLLVVPVRLGGGFAEVHFLASDPETHSLVRTLEEIGHPGPAPSTVALPPARETGPLRSEDWAFLGFLSAIGAFEGPDGPTPDAVAALLGTDPASFAAQARAVESGLRGLVTGMFSPPAGSPPGAVP